MILVEIEVLQLNLLSNVVYPAGVIETLSHNKPNLKNTTNQTVCNSFKVLSEEYSPWVIPDKMWLVWAVWIRTFPWMHFGGSCLV